VCCRVLQVWLLQCVAVNLTTRHPASQVCVLQCVSVCCRCVCCSVLQMCMLHCVAVTSHHTASRMLGMCVAVRGSGNVLQSHCAAGMSVAVCCSDISPHDTPHHRYVCCSVLQCVTVILCCGYVHCSALQ